MENKRILYCGYGIPVNIGNGFIDLGVKYSLSKAAPDFEIFAASNIQSELKRKYGERYNILNTNKISEFDSRAYYDVDIYMFAGALFNQNFLKENNILLRFLKEKQKPIIIYGASGCENYGEEEFAEVYKGFSELNVKCLITRDQHTFDAFNGLCDKSFNGVDCSFYLNDCYKPPKMTLGKYNIYTFDDIKEPSMESKLKVIRLQHDPWRLGRVERIIKHPIDTLSIMFRKDFVSDNPSDYLDLYANCEEVHSDRVHACAAAIVYGKKAKYYGRSPRSFMFERIGLKDIKNKLVMKDMKELEQIKKEQIAYLSECLNEFRNEKN